MDGGRKEGRKEGIDRNFQSPSAESNRIALNQMNEIKTVGTLQTSPRPIHHPPPSSRRIITTTMVHTHTHIYIYIHHI